MVMLYFASFLCWLRWCILIHAKLFRKKKAGPSERSGFLKKSELPVLKAIPPLFLVYLLLPTVAGAGACFWAQAPRVRVAAASATTATILVMVILYFASFLCWLQTMNLTPRVLSTKKNPEKI
jgi:hypothetical protein